MTELEFGAPAQADPPLNSAPEVNCSLGGVSWATSPWKQLSTGMMRLPLSKVRVDWDIATPDAETMAVTRNNVGKADGRRRLNGLTARSIDMAKESKSKS